jgi:hypothetical protein
MPGCQEVRQARRDANSRVKLQRCAKRHGRVKWQCMRPDLVRLDHELGAERIGECVSACITLLAE